MPLYPLKFEPILKQIIWGGSEICKFKGVTSDLNNIGESWEISGVEGNVSSVINGHLKGMRLDELIETYKTDLVGKKVYERFGNTFPLLIKFIDARDDLSIQVHPDDSLAMSRHNSFGKTEMWYVIDAKENAFLYSGFKKQMNADIYPQTIHDSSFIDYLEKIEVKPGDVFFLPAGRVHAIGAGTFIAEIQQTSNITYRIYDYKRIDANGNERELHTDLAKDAIDFRIHQNYRTQYTPISDQPVQLENNKYFTTHLLELKEPLRRDYSDTDSFVIYICMGGEAYIQDNYGNKLSLCQGESVLIPANTSAVNIHPRGGVKLLETYV